MNAESRATVDDRNVPVVCAYFHSVAQLFFHVRDDKLSTRLCHRGRRVHNNRVFVVGHG